nr:IS630 family transposase [Nitrosopumilus sp.]
MGHVIVSQEQLSNAYRKEIDADIKERIILVRRARIDGLEGLKDQPRSGRPPFISEKKMFRIRQKVMENISSGWEAAKQVMNLIYEKTGVRYHEVHIYRLLHRWGLTPKVPQKRFVNTIRTRERRFQKRVQEILSQIHTKEYEGFTIAVQDESIFVYDILVKRKLWLPKGIRPIVTATATGSHQKTCVFGTLTMKGKQLFRQYDLFNQDTFVDYLKQIKKRLGKVILFIDRAASQHRSKKIIEYLEDNIDYIRIIYLPKGSPQFNAVEECWRQGKYDLLVSKYYSRFTDLKSSISRYY